MLVIDASIAGPLTIPDKGEPLTAAHKIELMSLPLLVPSHWRLEVANMLEVAIKRRRLLPRQRAGVLARLTALDPEVDRRTSELAWTDTLAFADRHGLTPYDAAYLELALRRPAALATFDRDLAAAAASEGVRLAIAP